MDRLVFFRLCLVVSLLVWALILFGCEREAKLVPPREIHLVVRFDAREVCPELSGRPNARACTKYSAYQYSGQVSYEHPIVMHLEADKPLECVAHEFRHVLEGDWHGDREVPCHRY